MGGIPIPRHPDAARINRAYKLWQLRNPDSVNCSGFFFVAVNHLSESLNACG
jgi:hypothetical protein